MPSWEERRAVIAQAFLEENVLRVQVGQLQWDNLVGKHLEQAIHQRRKNMFTRLQNFGQSIGLKQTKNVMRGTGFMSAPPPHDDIRLLGRNEEALAQACALRCFPTLLQQPLAHLHMAPGVHLEDE